MKRFFVLFALLMLVASAANAQPPYLFEHNNEIGIYTEQNPTADNAQALATYSGAPGSFMAYVVLTNPYNENTGAMITRVGGFEFQLIVPADVFVLSAVMPPGSSNFHPDPLNWLAGSDVQVGDDAQVTLLTLNLFATAGPRYIYMAPVNSIPSRPGQILVTDAADEFSKSQIFPVSGGYDFPVFGLFSPVEGPGSVVPTEDASWGEVKSLYR